MTSDTYSMGNSVNVRCEDLPPFIVKKIETILAKYVYGHFDGMTDCYEYTNYNENLPQVKFARLNNNRSNEMDAAIIRHIKGMYAGFEGLTMENMGNFFSHDWDIYGSQMVYQMFTGYRESFWDDILTRAKAA